MDIRHDNGFFDEVGVAGQVLAVLIDANGRRRTFEGKNIVTGSGNRWYAARGALAASGIQVLGMKIGLGSVGLITPASTDADIASVSFASCFQSLDVGYPMLSDTDADNTGAGSNIVCWRVTYTATAATSQVSIADVCLCSVSAAPIMAINHAKFAAAFDKTAADTLKIFINHTFTSI